VRFGNLGKRDAELVILLGGCTLLVSFHGFCTVSGGLFSHFGSR
jgi:hypothetical protein